MTYREFVVPDEDEILETLGVEAEPIEGETAVWNLRFTSEAHELVFTYDMLRRGITIEWTHAGAPLITMTRDGAVLMRVEWVDKEGFIHIDFDTDELAGKLAVQVYPTISIQDTMMFS